MESEKSALENEIRNGAGFAIRLLARIIDSIYGYILGLIGGIIIGFIFGFLQVFGAVSPGWEQNMQKLGLIGVTMSIFGGVLYHTLTEGIHGASLGKALCRIRVISKNGSPCKLNKAAIRSLAYYWDGLFFGIVGYNSMKKSALNQRYGDVWAKTVVVRKTVIPDSINKSNWKFFLSFCIGSMLWVFMVALGLFLQTI
jgi:uncharacterized RDD family membrane protein YckC